MPAQKKKTNRTWSFYGKAPKDTNGKRNYHDTYQNICFIYIHSNYVDLILFISWFHLWEQNNFLDTFLTS